MFGRDRTRNAVSPEQNPPTDWEIGKYDEKAGKWVGSRNIRWASPLGSVTFGDPVVADGQVWVGTNNSSPYDASVLAGFATCDGKPLYRYVSPRLPQGRSHDFPMSAMACSPLIENARMWFTTNRCEMVCLDLGPLKRGETNPREVWKIDMIKRFGVKPVGSWMNVCRFCSVASYKDLIYVITGNGANWIGHDIPAPQAPSVICFKKDTGEVAWHDNSPGANILEGQWSSPLVIETGDHAQVVVPQGDGWLRSFDALTGRLIWKFDINPKTSKWSLDGRGTRNNIMATPVLYDGRVYVASGRFASAGPGRLVCIDPTKTGDISTELAIDAVGRTIPQRRIQAVDPQAKEKSVANPNSGLVWEFTHVGDGKEFMNVMYGTVSNVAVHNGLVIAADFAGLVHCLDAKTGKRYWVHEAFSNIYASPLIVENKVYVVDGDGTVSVFGLSPDSAVSRRKRPGEYEPLHQIEMGSGIYTSPIFANGTLYIATRSTLFAIAADKATESKAGAVSRGNGLHGNPSPRSVFVPTPQDVVEKMLELAKVKKTDVVYDLGSGDGRIVITAAKKYGSRAVGCDIDKELLESSRTKAEAAGVKTLVTFERKDLFTADLRDADVIAVYLVPKQLEQLMPQLDKLKPGARIVSHLFAIPGLKPDRAITCESQEDGEKHALFLWTAPLKKVQPALPKTK